MSAAVCGDHTVVAYSNCGRVKVLYALDLKSWLFTLIFLFRNPSVWLAFFGDIVFVSSQIWWPLRIWQHIHFLIQ